MGITHILNAAAPKKDLKFLLGMASEKDLLGTVNTGSRYYRGMNITYCGLPSFKHWANISKYFLPAAKFIHKALRNPTSKVLTHCTQGLSHSATLFLAYLMICHDMLVEEAIDHIIKVRCIKPYFGHLKHLAFLNAELVLQRKLKLQGKKTDKKVKKWQIKTKPEPEMDLIDPEESCVSDPSVPEPEPEMDLIDPEESCVSDPSVPEPEPEMDLVDPEKSCVSDPSAPEPEPEVTSELLRLENYIRLNVSQLEDRLRECTLSKTPVTEEMGITHILNAAAPKKDLKFLLGMASEKDLLGTVNTGSRYYRGMNITYCGLPSFKHWANISKYFLPAAKFIHKALRNPTSKVLTHCTQGLSHSVTLFLAYLMICHDMLVEEAIDHIIKVRCIKPYFGHLKHLAFLNAELVLQRKLKLQGKKTDKKVKKWQIKTK
ncbi:uncharacterized protein [Sinocyclocheilus grahami]|uniref:uncharacterized protein n=1 Tax=Sinocyclocheilus grahami TaxID=75366 RepID=UPI0007AD0EA9|nr:PREDICTED: uncharacterized protein LOC107568956 [Sinocyclocheilus grahami]